MVVENITVFGDVYGEPSKSSSPVEISERYCGIKILCCGIPEKPAIGLVLTSTNLVLC